LWDQAKAKEAVTAFHEAIRLRPGYAEAHAMLGEALRSQGKLDEAIAAYREATRLDPKDYMTLINLAGALRDRGKPAEAEVAGRAAVRLRPDHAAARSNLGAALIDQGDVAGAAAEWREAIRLDPDYAEAHINLGMALGQQGDYKGALAELREAHELGSARPNWRFPTAEWVKQAEQMAALADRVPAVLRGDDRPRDRAEHLALARVCHETKRFAAAARLLAEVMEADPGLADDPRAGLRYNAACCAALAASGQGKDDPPPDDASKARLRPQALAWLRADLALWSRQFDTDAATARRMLTHWRSDPDLTSVRDPGALAKLPEAEAAGWRALWGDVAALLAGRRPAPPAELPADPFAGP
jgi:tetratricopeptide (TPR) repeat protein